MSDNNVEDRLLKLETRIASLENVVTFNANLLNQVKNAFTDLKHKLNLFAERYGIHF